jgi:glucose-fructose oxidoreductase
LYILYKYIRFLSRSKPFYARKVHKYVKIVQIITQKRRKNTKMKKIRVAIFGLAHPHLSVIRKSMSDRPEDFEIIGFADVPPFDGYFHDDLTVSLRDRHGIKEYSDWKELVAQKPDFAVVTTDNALREEVCCTLLSAGINVLDEKPMALTFEAAKRMYLTAKENGVKMLVNWPIAWFPPFRLAKKLVDEGKIGKVMRVTYRSPATWGVFSYSADGELPPEEFLLSSWWYHKERGGGSVMDYACYGAMLSTWIFGKQAERVSGITKNFEVPFADIEDFSAMMLDFGDGVGLLEGSWSTYNCGEVPSGPVIHGTKGTIVCDRYSSKVKIYMGRSHKPVEPTEVIDAGMDNQAELLGAHLVKVLRGEEKEDEMLSAELNLKVVAALDAGLESATTGKAVTTKEV